MISLLEQTASAERVLDGVAWDRSGIRGDMYDGGPPQFHPGLQLGPYILEARLGSGGMGVVYSARDTKLNRVVAIKFLSDEFPGATARARFQREARLASALNHPHIVVTTQASSTAIAIWSAKSSMAAHCGNGL